MKYLFSAIYLLTAAVSFAQPNRAAVALQDEAQFDLSFIFQHQDKTSFSISFIREENVDYMSINYKDCQPMRPQYKQPITDNYTYIQMLDYFQNIDITSFQPSQQTQSTTSTFQVQGMINIQRTWTVNAFVFPYNPYDSGEENQMLEYIALVLSDNANDDCSKKVAEKLSSFLE